MGKSLRGLINAASKSETPAGEVERGFAGSANIGDIGVRCPIPHLGCVRVG
jgi:hypothetical protein